MSTVIYNPTNEDFENMMWGGKGMPLKAGQKMSVEDACARHLLNGYTARGLCILEFSEDPNYLKNVKADGIRRNMAFKKNMVVKHNERNATRKQAGQSYLEPTSHVIKYAEELGIALDQPFAHRDKENERMAVLEYELAEQKKMNSDLMGKLNQILSAQTAPTRVKKEGVSVT
jgi:hypothetical protein